MIVLSLHCRSMMGSDFKQQVDAPGGHHYNCKG